MSTTYQQGIIAVRVTRPGNAPLDINGQLCSMSGRKQAIMILEGEENPDPNKYEIFSTFEAGETVDGFQTIVNNSELCISDVYEFEVDKTSLSYGVSYQGLGFSFTDAIQVTSSVNNSFSDYTVTSKPDWITATQGTTLGVVNTLNLTIDRNRTDDNDRLGNIVLTQKETGATRTITITQKGRLTEGIPTEYPYVNNDTILEKEYPVVQIGEQIWTQMNLDGIHRLSQSHIDQWKITNPTKYAPTVEEYNYVFNYGCTRENKKDIQNKLIAEANSIDDGTYHMLPYSDDFKELLGFIITNSGADSWNNFSSTSLGYTLAKKNSNTTTDGYDDVRRFYPKTWIDAVNSGSLDELDVKTGLDKYALGFMTAGIFQPFDINSQYTLLYGFLQMHLRDTDPANDNEINLCGYSIASNINNQGIYLRYNDHSAYSVRNVRTLRYRKIPFEIYQNGSEIRKIRNGDSIPDGFTILPKGAMRGLWFGNTDLSYSILKDMSGWVDAFIQNLSNKMG